MEKSDVTLIVAWCDEDGMEFEKIHDPVKARQKLRDLFEEQAGEDFSDDHLSYYVEEWEPELKDPYSEEDEYGFRTYWGMTIKYDKYSGTCSNKIFVKEKEQPQQQENNNESGNE